MEKTVIRVLAEKIEALDFELSFTRVQKDDFRKERDSLKTENEKLKEEIDTLKKTIDVMKQAERDACRLKQEVKKDA